MKKIIRLTESDLHNIIKESVRKTLNEIRGTELNGFGYDARNMRNMLGINDDDELNAACDAETYEELESSIAKDMCNEYGYSRLYDKTSVFDFDTIEQLLEEKYNMHYVGADEEQEAIIFENDNAELLLYPTIFYPKPNRFRLSNMHILAK